MTRSKASARQGGSGLASTREAESRLNLALSELKAAREEVTQLIREREDNEKELLDVLEKGSQLKKDMAELHTQHLCVIEERDRLQSIVDGFGECSQEYVHNLRRVTLLEQELQEAHHQITSLETERQEFAVSQTQSLFDELICSAPDFVPDVVNQNPTVTIDLTCNDTLCSSPASGLVECSRNKLKKYIKINRFIKKTKKLIKKEKSSCNNLKCIKERQRLGDELDLYTLTLDNNITTYEKTIKNFEHDIEMLKSSLDNMTVKYMSSKKENEEHILALKSLINSSHQLTVDHNISLQESQAVCDSSFSICDCDNMTTLANTKKSSGSFAITSNVCVNNIVMFSDELGKDMGLLLSNLMGQPVINNCFPSTPFIEIVNKISHYTFNENSILILLIGNRGNVNKKVFMQCLDILNNLNLKQIVMFTFPYNKNLPQSENNFRYKLNLTMSTLSLNFNNSLFHCIDYNVNKDWTDNLYLTNDILHLPKYVKRQIAKSLSFCIDHTAKNLAKHPAFIEQQSVLYIKTLESIPSHLNYTKRQ